MPKYDYDFKRQCISAYLAGKPLPEANGLLPGSLVRYVHMWIRLEHRQGEKGLDNSIIYRNYTIKEKIAAVKAVKSGKSYTQVANSIGMRSHSTVRRWYLDYLKDGISGLQYRKGIKPSTSIDVSTIMKKRLSKSEREELISVRKRNEILEAENEYLKKLDALVSKREKEEAKAKKQK